MKAPFVFGRIATKENFTDREQETLTLIQNFTSLINTIIISPRRWGKSSLVNKASLLAMENDSSLHICHIDLFNVRSEEQFYSLMAQKIISATSSKWDEAIENVKACFSRLIPKISIGTDPSNEISLSFDYDELIQNPDEVLDLAEKIAQKKSLKIVICIDEFQNIAEFTDSNSFQKKLRSHWQQHQRVAYCLYGSKRHMMMEVFTNYSKPFYKFGELLFLDKLDTLSLVKFFGERFQDTGKSISRNASALIADLVDNHPYYAQQLAQLCWLRTEKDCTEEIVNEAFITLVDQLCLLFMTITETLTTQQLNYLHALIAGEKNITSTKTMHLYRISSSTAASRSRASLIQNDILDSKAGKLFFQDPIYRYWLETRFFNSLPSNFTRLP